MRIAQGPPATLDPTTAASADFRAFVSAALVKEPAARPSAAALRAHAFLGCASQPELRELVEGVLAGTTRRITTI